MAVCAHDAMQQEAAEKQSGYNKKKMMQWFSKPEKLDVPDSRQHSTGPNTAGSGAVTPLDRVSEGSLSLMGHGSNGELSHFNTHGLDLHSPLDRVSQGSLSLLCHGSNGKLRWFPTLIHMGWICIACSVWSDLPIMLSMVLST